MSTPHQTKMQTKALARAADYAVRSRQNLPLGFRPASINPKTGRPHEHKREIARRLARA